MKTSAKKALRRITTWGSALGLLTMAVSFVVAGSGPAAAASSGAGDLTVGYDLSGSSVPVEFDPASFTTTAGYLTYLLPIYDGLLRETSSGSFVPDLASSVTVANPSTIDIQIRPGEVFSDGTPFTAAAVKAGLERNINTTNKGGFLPSLYQISSIDVTGPDSLVLNFSQPVASIFYPNLASQESFIVSPKAAAAGTLGTDPVGAGAFMFKSYVPNEKLVLVKNPKYWDAKSIHLSQITFVSVPAGPQQINALESGLINAVDGLPATDIPTLKGLSSSVQVKSAFQDGSVYYVPICTSSGPLANVKVRQALSYAVNRPEINKALLYGLGQPAWSLVPSGFANYDNSLTGHYAYNPTKAKELLAQAGYPHGFSTTILPLQEPATEQLATILQQEFKQIGVTLQIESSSDYVNDFYVRHTAAMAVNPVMGPGGITDVSAIFTPGSIGDTCNYSSPTLNALVTKASNLPASSPELKVLWDQMQQFIIGNALSIFVVNSPTIAASSKSVKDLQIVPTIGGVLDYWTMSVS
jgi:peptide/nickel transport system substrate-binding protein